VLAVSFGGDGGAGGRLQVRMPDPGQGEQGFDAADLGEQDRDVGGGGPERPVGAGPLCAAVMLADGTKVNEGGGGVLGLVMGNGRSPSGRGRAGG
jgi:hypothetical protein